MDATYCIFGGDFNTDLTREQAPHTQELNVFCEAESMLPCCRLPLSSVKHSFECSVTFNRSLIDHFIVSDNILNCIIKYSTIDSFDCNSDHSAIMLTVDIPCSSVSYAKRNYEPKVAWYKASIHDIEKYKCNIDIELGKIAIPTGCANCKNVTCSKHVNEIEKFHNDILNACISAASVLPQMSHSEQPHRDKRIPGWNDYCAHKRDKALYFHKLWQDAGRPQCGRLADLRRTTRAQYHHAIRVVQRNQVQSQKMAESILKSDTRNLFSEAKKMRGHSGKIPGKFDGIPGDQNIANAFADRFECVFSSVPSGDQSLEELNSYIKSRVPTCDVSDHPMEFSDFGTSSKALNMVKWMVIWGYFLIIL